MLSDECFMLSRFSGEVSGGLHVVHNRLFFGVSSRMFSLPGRVGIFFLCVSV